MQTPELSFIQSRIAAIGTALFFCDNKSVLPFPAYIVTALKTDDDGNIWFFISKSWNKKVTYNVAFGTTLEFYRKGYPFLVKIGGQASLVSDKKIMQAFMQNLLGKSVPVKEEAIRGVLLVKVKIEHAVCKDFTPRKSFKPFHNIILSVKNAWSPVQHMLEPAL